MARYLACGNILYDTVESIDDVDLGEHLGGQAMYATAGIRLWTKSVKTVSSVGADYKDGYSPWFRANGLTESGLSVESDYCSHVVMHHTKSGAYDIIPTPAGLKYVEYEQGYLETKPENIERAIDPDTVAFYHHTHLPDTVIFGKLRDIMEKHGVRFMWEIMYVPGRTQMESPYFNMDKLRAAVKTAGMWSLNRNEAADIFRIPRDRDEDIITELLKFEGAEMCYYRCGSKGAYVVTGNNAYFCPMIDVTESVDPMGCGNNSTAASMYAWCETGNPLMTAVMSAISAGYNAAQSGPWPVFTDEDMKHARELALRYYGELVGKYPDLPREIQF
ncbi:MAG: carbohydrate kinase family protein [Oscillospiraceae bacterium]|jgi:sugar/nucleoside kinase (ribokinase family)